MDWHVFEDHVQFRTWLHEHAKTHPGIWMLFGKAGGPKTLTPDDALKEALCYGWIDGQLRKIDETKYIKYFAKRQKKSIWSSRNKRFVASLIQEGKMTDMGFDAIKMAKDQGTWDQPLEYLDEDHVSILKDAIKKNEIAYAHYCAMSSSVQKTYAGFYLSAKRKETKEKRLETIIDRLKRNLKPME